jgi:primosomal protein N''
VKTYEPGKGNVKDLNRKLKEYRDVERQIEDAIQEKRKELARIETAKNKLKSKATYMPSREAMEYWAAHCLEVAQQPQPIYGGPAGLRAAVAEIDAYEARQAAA